MDVLKRGILNWWLETNVGVSSSLKCRPYKLLSHWMCRAWYLCCSIRQSMVYSAFCEISDQLSHSHKSFPSSFFTSTWGFPFIFLGLGVGKEVFRSFECDTNRRCISWSTSASTSQSLSRSISVSFSDWILMWVVSTESFAKFALHGWFMLSCLLF